MDKPDEYAMQPLGGIAIPELFPPLRIDADRLSVVLAVAFTAAAVIGGAHGWLMAQREARPAVECKPAAMPTATHRSVSA